jgi:hypothetical protein
VHTELREETGYCVPASGGGLHPLGYYFSSQGYTDEHGYLFLATNVVESREAGREALGEGGECILDVRAFAPEEVWAMIASNEIRDANTLALFARMVAHGQLGPGRPLIAVRPPPGQAK